jgi:phosphoglycolate phosphatase-like HAD superfamily hydrolase
VSDETSPQFVPPEQRIAAFDNDGTLWCEKPMYIQLAYIIGKLALQAEADPALRTQEPWQAAWTKNYQWMGDAVTRHYQGDDSALHQLLGGILALAKDADIEQVEAEAKAFVEHAEHPSLGRPYMACAYAPMIELLRLLEAHNFTSYIVSGGGRDFMRGFAHDLYGIPRQRVIGSTVAYRYMEQGEHAYVVQAAELDVVDDGPGKPIQIWNSTGRRPILAAGNSNGDFEMLKFAGGKELPSLRLLVVHDDSAREFAYTAGAEMVLAAAQSRGWTQISMQHDWRTIFAD